MVITSGLQIASFKGNISKSMTIPEAMHPATDLMVIGKGFNVLKIKLFTRTSINYFSSILISSSILSTSSSLSINSRLSKR